MNATLKEIRARLRTTVILFAGAALLVASPWTGLCAGFGEPSNPAGVWEMTVGPGAQLLSFPVLPDDATVTSLLGGRFPGGTQWSEATRIVTLDGGQVLGSFYSSLDNEWLGTLDNLRAKRAYWLILPDGSDPVEMRLVGAGLPMTETLIDTLRPGVNAVACPAVVPVMLAGSGLTESGFHGAEFPARADRVYAWSQGLLAPAWRNPSLGWTGAQFTLHPGHGYLIEVAAGEDDLYWTRPELIVGTEPPRGGETPRLPPGIAPLLRPFGTGFTSSPWGSSVAPDSRGTGGRR